ncbi:hypothetical protein [Pseudomonas matsuisoli]|uniref:Uncharacterized protein n=1 Tax=Pseudomonas matsuisoli TaxID=1515666 RepID=A0A917PYW6_9PSED|nr:hypothetical protein [Pseudomonas matsuisoli]GGK00087.1 hypothetical protein GCM10009304_27360 [Pseudomonas matsuisoli]
MKFSDWSPRERLVAALWAAVAAGCLIYALASNVAVYSSEFFSMLAIIALLVGLALTPSFMFKPLKLSLGEEMEPSLKVAFGFFCAFQLVAIGIRIL